MDECSWPWCHIQGCESCQKYETMYGENLTAWLDQKAEVRAAAKDARRRTTTRGVSAPEPQGSE